jgi:trehalose 6-phosphate phosphatase
MGSTVHWARAEDDTAAARTKAASDPLIILATRRLQLAGLYDVASKMTRPIQLWQYGDKYICTSSLKRGVAMTLDCESENREESSLVPLLRRDVALFLGVDGTLQDVELDASVLPVDEALRLSIERIWVQLDGALALISGRPIEQLDRCVGWNGCAAAGVHGLERRDSGKVLHREPASSQLRSAHAILVDVLSVGHGVKVEDKGGSLAIHFRDAPEREVGLRRAALLMLKYLGPEYRLLEGQKVLELLPRSSDKGTALRAFMAEPPFHGRHPVYVGDDVTDLDGFRAARELGGYGIAVGPHVRGDFTLPDVQALRGWLGAVV